MSDTRIKINPLTGKPDLVSKAWILGGNNLTALGKIGTKNAFSLSVITNNVEAILVDTTQRVFFRNTAEITGNFDFLGSARFRGISNFVSVRADVATTPYTLTLPTTIGTNGFVLKTNGVDKTDWIDPNVNDIPEWIAPPTFTQVGSTFFGTGLQGQKAVDDNYIYFCFTDGEWAASPRIL